MRNDELIVIAFISSLLCSMFGVFVGDDKEIGYFKGFLFCLFLGIIGVIIVMFSKKKIKLKG